jgi:hypothetical protein
MKRKDIPGIALMAAINSLQNSPAIKCWLLSKEGRPSWHTYDEDIANNAVKDGWKAEEVAED